MKSVYKYILDYCWNVPGNPCYPYTIKLPKGATILSCGVQNKENVYIWAKVDPNQTETVETKFYIFGTGWDIPDEIDNGLRFIGTYMLNDGMYVFHVFVKEPEPSNSINDTSSASEE